MKKIKKIDAHAHLIAFPQYYPTQLGSTPDNRLSFLSADEMFEIYDKLNVEKAVLLPIVSMEGQCAPMSTEACAYLAEEYPDKLVWCCNVDPRSGMNKPDTDLGHFLEHYKALGAKGFGELTTQLYADDPYMENLFSYCEKLDLPVTIHISAGPGNIDGNGYGIMDEMGLPRLEKILKKYPKLKILGHSQLFWCEISGDLTLENRKGAPTGKVTEGTITRLMRTYDNLYCDVSAYSGSNAMMRDAEHAAKFMEEFSDRIVYGCDVCRLTDTFQYKFDAFLDNLVETGAISEETYEKIVRKNAIRIFKLDME